MFLHAKKEKIYPGYVSKHNSNREKQVILLMISNGKGREAISEGEQHYLSVNKISALLGGITSKNNGKFFWSVWIVFILLKQKRNLNILEFSQNKKKILKFSQYQKSDKGPFIIYADLECLIEKTDGCENNPETSSTTKLSEHIPWGFSMSTISSLRK